MKTNDIIDNNRVILAEISNKIKEKKVNELSDEHLLYAKILVTNGLIDNEGNITDAGKEAILN